MRVRGNEGMERIGEEPGSLAALRSLDIPRRHPEWFSIQSLSLPSCPFLTIPLQHSLLSPLLPLLSSPFPHSLTPSQPHIYRVFQVSCPDYKSKYLSPQNS